MIFLVVGTVCRTTFFCLRFFTGCVFVGVLAFVLFFPISGFLFLTLLLALLIFFLQFLILLSFVLFFRCLSLSFFLIFFRIVFLWFCQQDAVMFAFRDIGARIVASVARFQPIFQFHAST